METRRKVLKTMPRFLTRKTLRQVNIPMLPLFPLMLNLTPGQGTSGMSAITPVRGRKSSNPSNSRGPMWHSRGPPCHHLRPCDSSPLSSLSPITSGSRSSGHHSPKPEQEPGSPRGQANAGLENLDTMAGREESGISNSNPLPELVSPRRQVNYSSENPSNSRRREELESSPEVIYLGRNSRGQQGLHGEM